MSREDATQDLEERFSTNGQPVDNSKLCALVKQDYCGIIDINLATTMPGCIFRANGKNGCIELNISSGQITGFVRSGHEHRIIDAEDVPGIDDGFAHSVALSSNESATQHSQPPCHHGFHRLNSRTSQSIPKVSTRSYTSRFGLVKRNQIFLFQ